MTSALETVDAPPEPGKLAGCELCELTAVAAATGVPALPALSASQAQGVLAQVVLRHEKFIVILVDDPGYPGFARVIWNDHVREMSDLADQDRLLLNDAVWKVEQALRDVMQPLKVNLASLGNVVPHLHWHVIPRYVDDAHFPAPVWAQAASLPAPSVLEARRALLPRLAEAITRRFASR